MILSASLGPFTFLFALSFAGEKDYDCWLRAASMRNS